MPIPKTLPKLHPQHFTWAVFNKTHIVCTDEGNRRTAYLFVPKSSDGRLSPIESRLLPRSKRSPYPSCPKLFFPKHFTALLSRIAHTNVFATDIERTVLPYPKSTNVFAACKYSFPNLNMSRVSVPNMPLPLNPQHFIRLFSDKLDATVLSTTKAHV